jgi:hypothetical protein
MDALVNSFVEDNPGIKWCPAPGIILDKKKVRIKVVKMLFY